MIFCGAAWFLAPKGENQTYVVFHVLFAGLLKRIKNRDDNSHHRAFYMSVHHGRADGNSTVSGAQLSFSPLLQCTSCGPSPSSHNSTHSSPRYETICDRSTTKGKPTVRSDGLHMKRATCPANSRGTAKYTRLLAAEQVAVGGRAEDGISRLERIV